MMRKRCNKKRAMIDLVLLPDAKRKLESAQGFFGEKFFFRKIIDKASEPRYSCQTCVKKKSRRACWRGCLNETLNVGMIACGNVTLGYHVPALLALNDLSISGIADSNEPRARLDMRPADVLLAVLPEFRQIILQDCADARVQVRTEKPLAIVPRDAQAMIEVRGGARLKLAPTDEFNFLRSGPWAAL
jgi:hypothetical protein